MLMLALSTDGVAAPRPMSPSTDPLVEVPAVWDISKSRTVWDGPNAGHRDVAYISLDVGQAVDLIEHLKALVAGARD